jgi:intracellular sulfur oxidation DsrE/DsrF family protein
MRVLLHAPTAGALMRARSNLRNLRAANPDAEILIVANADGVAAAIAARDPETDSAVRLCANTLRARRLDAPADLATIPAAVEMLARLQAEGWIYIRA